MGKYKSLLFILVSVIGIAGVTIFFLKNSILGSSSIEIIEATPTPIPTLMVDISGEVQNPGVYEFSQGDRIYDAIDKAGGLTANADKAYIEKILNKASLLNDGQKIYIPSKIQQTNQLSANKNGSGSTVLSISSVAENALINVNTANQKDLELLPGIGPKYAQNIIEHRPYSLISELHEKKVISKSVFEKIKDKITI